MSRTFRGDLESQLEDAESAKAFGAAQARSSLALTLAGARRKAGLTQKELAARAGVSQAYIAKLEGGEANPTLGRVGSLLSVLGLGLATDTASLSPYLEASPADSLKRVTSPPVSPSPSIKERRKDSI